MLVETKDKLVNLETVKMVKDRLDGSINELETDDTRLKNDVSNIKTKLPYGLGIDINDNYGYIPIGSNEVIPFNSSALTEVHSGWIGLNNESVIFKIINSGTAIANLTINVNSGQSSTYSISKNSESVKEETITGPMTTGSRVVEFEVQKDDIITITSGNGACLMAAVTLYVTGTSSGGSGEPVYNEILNRLAEKVSFGEVGYTPDFANPAQEWIDEIQEVGEETLSKIHSIGTIDFLNLRRMSDLVREDGVKLTRWVVDRVIPEECNVVDVGVLHIANGFNDTYISFTNDIVLENVGTSFNEEELKKTSAPNPTVKKTAHGVRFINDPELTPNGHVVRGYLQYTIGTDPTVYTYYSNIMIGKYNDGFGGALPVNDPVVQGTFSMQYTTSSGLYSHSIGQGATASGVASHAEGQGTTASGAASHAEGAGTNATSSQAHAEGAGSTASGAASHAEGQGTTASEGGSHAEGSGTKALNYQSHAEGSMTTASGAQSHSEGNSTIASGAQSHAEGSNTKADGYTSHAEGSMTTASGAQSHAEGNSTTASGVRSHAEGSNTKADGYASHAEGGDKYSDGTDAYNYTHTVDSSTQVEIKASTSEGSSSHAEGFQNLAYGFAAHAEGNQSMASGFASHAEGSGTKATGHYSHAENSGAKASGSYSHAGGSAEASGIYSFAHGSNSLAKGESSVAFGYQTTAVSDNSMVIGKQNKYDTNSEYAFQIGNGYFGDYGPVDSDAFHVKWDGTAEASGDVVATDTDGTTVSLIEVSKNGLSATDVSENYVPTANGDGTWEWKEQQGGSSGNVPAEIQIETEEYTTGTDYNVPLSATISEDGVYVIEIGGSLTAYNSSVRLNINDEFTGTIFEKTQNNSTWEHFNYTFARTLQNNDTISLTLDSGSKTYGLYIKLNKLYIEGVSYLIKGENYSTEEQVIGRWIDGKPLYQRSYDLYSYIVVESTWTETSIIIENAERIISCKTSNEGASYLVNSKVSTDGKVSLASVRSSGDNNRAYVRYITIQYTKTTDTASTPIQTSLLNSDEIQAMIDASMGTLLGGEG